MEKVVYVPEFTPNSCCYMNDSQTMRCYDRKPVLNSTIGYIDYFVNSHYLSRTGVTNFGNYTSISYDCLDTSKLTTDFYYRNDFGDILLVFFIMVFFVFFIVSKCIRVFFHGFRWC